VEELIDSAVWAEPVMLATSDLSATDGVLDLVAVASRTLRSS
jgi:hypothetical protein